MYSECIYQEEGLFSFVVIIQVIAMIISKPKTTVLAPKSMPFSTSGML